MVTGTKKRAKTTRSTKAKVSKKEKDSTLAEVEHSIDKKAVLDFVESTKDELKKLGEKIHEATDKSLHVAKEIAEDVRRFSRDATDLTKIKIELHNLKTEKEKRYTLIGKHLRNLHKAQNLKNIRSKFKKDFTALDELESDINKKEKQVAGISLLKGKAKRKSKS